MKTNIRFNFQGVFGAEQVSSVESYGGLMPIPEVGDIVGHHGSKGRVTHRVVEYWNDRLDVTLEIERFS